MAAETIPIGVQLIALRRRRKMSQTQLAETAGVSVDVIRKLEQRRRESARVETLTQLARALDVPVSELIGKAPGLTFGAEDSEVFHLRRAVLGYIPTDGDVSAPGQLRAGLPELWQRYWAGDYPQLARELPARITAARVTASSSRGDAQPIAYTVLAELLQVTAALLAHLAYDDLAHLALHGAQQAAEAADDALLLASQQATRSWVLSRQGLWSEAEQVAATAAEQVEPRLSHASVDQVAIWGELLRYTALALSRSGRHREAADVIRLMGAAAARMGEDQATRYTGVAFGPIVVGMRAVDAQISAEQPRKALALAAQLTDLDPVPAAMQMRYLLNVAWAQTVDWRTEEAVRTLRRAEALAPVSFPFQSIARSVIAELLPRRRTQRLPGLAALADRAGVAAT